PWARMAIQSVSMARLLVTGPPRPAVRVRYRWPVSPCGPAHTPAISLLSRRECSRLLAECRHGAVPVPDGPAPARGAPGGGYDHARSDPPPPGLARPPAAPARDERSPVGQSVRAPRAGAGRDAAVPAEVLGHRRRRLER